MGKFNKTAKPQMTETYEGAKAYEVDPVSAWMNYLFSSLMSDTFYETENEQTSRFLELTDEVADSCGYEFVAKSAFFARNELGMRSVSEYVAAYLNDKVFNGKRNFYRNFFHRPDDVAEVFSAVDSIYGKKSHALIRGAGDYLSTLSGYHLDKYSMDKKTWSMHDLINVTHAFNKDIDAFQKGELEHADTWEQAFAQNADSEDRAAELKRLIDEGKIGYMALLRNLNNVLKYIPMSKGTEKWYQEVLYPQLEDEEKIRKSLVFPYRIYTAYKNLDMRNPQMVAVLDRAFRKSVSNMPELSGDNLIILDVSGSMDDPISKRSKITIKEAGAAYAAAIMLANDCDFVKFGNNATFKSYNMYDNVFNVISKMTGNDDLGYGTVLASAIEKIDKSYDRIFIISDMQTAVKGGNYWDLYYYNSYDVSEPVDEIKDYRCKFGSSTHFYSFDLGNYRTSALNSKDPKVHLLTALNDTMFKMLEYVEDSGKLVDFIENGYDYM